ncbi:DUF547 domain-containing protein [Marinobacterium rhizophilum]|uniref:DUF547 domain-containing protein n=1 Tax=Marinobacterium rhizophilum TaxID=420402 RepID=A0ABY5HD72_9GAMM|nr:DUF547 domain-containing protein [Marinobacterium rhizophilum]UTW10276.1 DUF547 domain-containing protein [Marinobacterium rhizophilum]
MYKALFLLLLSLFTTQYSAASFDHSDWDRLLKTHVLELQNGRATQLDYTAVTQQRPQLSAYLARLSDVQQPQFDAWTKDDQLAFLINAYNAWTVELILGAYPDLASIKELGSLFQSPWKKAFVPLLGEQRSLDNIEHDLIRGSRRYRDPRIHFAVNCASIGCPALRAEAYSGSALEQQLEQQTRLFLQDRSRNRSTGQRLELSSIFKWYAEDFSAGWRGAESLEQFLTLYADALGLNETQLQHLRAGNTDIDFLDYDWNLNDIQR